MSVRATDTDGVLVITLDRPEAYNAFDRAQAEGLSAALDRLDADDALTCGVITGAGGRFCAGSDLRAVAAGASMRVPPRGFYGMLERPPAKPVIAAVEGAAVGGGWELAMACDLVVAARGAVFALPEVHRGVIASGGALARLPRRVPYHLAMELLLTGRSVPAEEAARLGFVNRVTEDGGALAGALALAAEVGRGGPVAVRATKEGVDRSLDGDADHGWAVSRELVERVVASEDMAEGVAAFLEKREPRWTGR
ncbi:crotonase/enoyl-CoA hydratase family protein [Patulibacter sp.]|uniref:crotonase/enoyl-CoA hydratase family protein n=1 Tax=Patulibacter sp. TaxID=1912859 RepID=UPI00271FB268|nr:crotonase/enoyl-CoA hydratase family protein [Patulibacter sp.]MDO9410826.1 crotonase/enoyl-CoA hydratase family protein [Patulibacter sp.]